MIPQHVIKAAEEHKSDQEMVEEHTVKLGETDPSVWLDAVNTSEDKFKAAVEAIAAQNPEMAEGAVEALQSIFEEAGHDMAKVILELGFKPGEEPEEHSKVLSTLLAPVRWTMVGGKLVIEKTGDAASFTWNTTKSVGRRAKRAAHRAQIAVMDKATAIAIKVAGWLENHPVISGLLAIIGVCMGAAAVLALFYGFFFLFLNWVFTALGIAIV